MKKKKVILWLLLGVPLICATLFLAFMGYCATQPKFYTEVGRQIHNDKEFPKNEKLALWFYRKGASMGDATAQYILGTGYYYGRDVQKDYEKALFWYQKAAEQGCVDAQYAVGWMLENGGECSPDDSKVFQ